MSVNVYFTDEVKKLDGFTNKPYKDNSGNAMKIDGLSLFDDKGRLYAMLGDENSVVPDKLKDYVIEVSFRDSMPQGARRETGIYRHESAEAEVEYDRYEKNQKPNYSICIIGKEIKDIRDLLRMIKTGAIRPEESYEGQQLGMSRAELERQFGQVTAERDDLAKQLHLAEETFRNEQGSYQNACKKNVAIRNLARKLHAESWQPCTKASIAGRIDQILDSVVL